MADGSTETWTAVTGTDGLAIVNVTILSGEAEFIASNGTLTSNAININGLLP